MGWRERQKIAGMDIQYTIVAGIVAAIPEPTNASSFLLLQAQLNDLREKFRICRESYCYCCRCSYRSLNGANKHKTSLSSVDSICSGCTRHLCFSSLKVLFYYESITNALTPPLSENEGEQSVPTISNSSLGYPLVWTVSQVSCSNAAQCTKRQILLYKRHNTSNFVTVGYFDRRDTMNTAIPFALYRHGSGDSSFFSGCILQRLTHATMVLDALVTKHTDTITRDKCKSLPLDAHADSRLGESCSDFTNSSCPSIPFRKDDMKSFIIRYSFLARHFYLGGIRKKEGHQHHVSYSGSLMPLVEVVNVLLGRSNTSVPSDDTCPHQCEQIEFSESDRFQSLYRLTTQKIARCDYFLSVLIDAGLGLLIAAALLTGLYRFQEYQLQGTNINIKDMALSHYRHLSTGLLWLERYPFGFKLNERLLENVGREIQRLWKVHELIVLRLCSLEWSPLCKNSAVSLAALLSMALGGSGVVALAWDAMWLITAHAWGVSFVSHRIYCLELTLLTALWRLFRGKKRNILRHRTDTMEYDAMQLLLGTVLFAVVLFLFTTILAYHVFFSCLYMVILLVTLPLDVLYVFLNRMPWGSIWYRCIHPRLFTCDIHLSDTTPGGSIDVTTLDVTRLDLRFLSFSSIIAEPILIIVEPTLVWLVQNIGWIAIGLSSTADILDVIFVFHLDQMPIIKCKHKTY